VIVFAALRPVHTTWSAGVAGIEFGDKLVTSDIVA
jgi:hypothetical protein